MQVRLIIAGFLIFIASMLFFVEARFGIGLIDKIAIFPKSNIIYKQACANYITNFLNVNYNRTVIITERDLKESSIKKTQITPKSRINLADKNNKIDIMAIDNMKLSINNNVAYNLTCWINAKFSGDPYLITSYDILYININNFNKGRNSFSIKEENY